MDEEKKIAIRERIFELKAVAEDSFESAVLLHESEKYRASIPLLRDSVLNGIKALLMLYLDDLPDDSSLVDSYNQTEISKEIKLDISVTEVLKKLRNAEQDSLKHPLRISKECIKDLDICEKQIENFLAKAGRVVKKSVLTTQEIKKRKFVRKLMITASAAIVAILVIVRVVSWLATLGNGLTGEYFAGQNFEKLIEIRTDRKIDFDWGDEPIINEYFDNVNIRWSGEIKAPKTGEYGFITISDDGVRLWIDGELIIDDWNVHYNKENRARIHLERGYHTIKIEYFEQDGGAMIELMWRIAGQQRDKDISPKYLEPSPPQK